MHILVHLCRYDISVVLKKIDAKAIKVYNAECSVERILKKNEKG